MGTAPRQVGRAVTFVVAVAFFLTGHAPAAHALDIEGVTPGGKALITSPGVVFAQSVNTPVVLKVRLRVTTPGFALRLCMGSFADFLAGNCSIGVNGVAAAQLSASGQRFDGFALLDNTQLFDKLLYVINVTSGAQEESVGFVVTIE